LTREPKRSIFGLLQAAVTCIYRNAVGRDEVRSLCLGLCSHMCTAFYTSVYTLCKLTVVFVFLVPKLSIRPKSSSTGPRPGQIRPKFSQIRPESDQNQGTHGCGESFTQRVCVVFYTANIPSGVTASGTSKVRVGNSPRTLLRKLTTFFPAFWSLLPRVGTSE